MTFIGGIDRLRQSDRRKFSPLCMGIGEGIDISSGDFWGRRILHYRVR